MIKNYLTILRIPHWIKNVFVFVPLVFSGTFSEPLHTYSAILAFITFSITSSCIYITNDIFDKEEDANHPKKRLRPVAAGNITKLNAFLFAIILLAVQLIFIKSLPLDYWITILVYIIINILYSIKLKEIVIIDIFIIASGFILRVIGGALAIGVLISNWLILTTLFLSLFLGVMKRRAELNTKNLVYPTRKVLEYYSNSFLDQISAITAGGVIICYALYTVSERAESFFHSEWIIYSTIFVIFGILRYMFLVYHKNSGEDPVKEIITDFPMIINIILYTLTIFIIAN